MSFGTNLQYLRKRDKMTQEDFAERMGVSRQSVSKWESDAAFPEMEKLIQICDMYNCKLDALLRGNVEEELHTDVYGYDKHMSSFIKKTTIGVALIFAGLTVMFLMLGLGISENISPIILLFFIAISLPFFIIGGLENDDFKKKHPNIENFYTEEQTDAFFSKFRVLISVGCLLIFFAVMWLIICDTDSVRDFFSTKAAWENLIMVPFFTLIGTAVSVFVYSGMTKDKFEFKEYKKSDINKSERSLTGKICAVIMLVAAAVYIVWTDAWIVFPIGGILCAIVGVIFGKKK